MFNYVEKINTESKKKRKRPPRGTETAQKNIFFIKNVTRNRAAIEAKNEKIKKPESWTLKGRTPPFRRLICFSKRISVVRGAELCEFVSSNFFGEMCVFVSRPVNIENCHFSSENGDLPKLVVDFPLETRIPKNMEIVLHCLHVSSFFVHVYSLFLIFLHFSSCVFIFFIFHFSSLVSFFIFSLILFLFLLRYQA